MAELRADPLKKRMYKVFHRQESVGLVYANEKTKFQAAMRMCKELNRFNGINLIPDDFSLDDRFAWNHVHMIDP